MQNESIYEDGNGGQLLLRNYEIIQTKGIAVLAYLKMFGGNIEENTQKVNSTGEIRNDWWGNNTTDDSNKWINSSTERILRGVELTNQNLANIKEAVKKDLKSLERYGKINIAVSYPLLNTVKINIEIIEPNKKEYNSLVLIWDATRNEIIEQNRI